MKYRSFFLAGLALCLCPGMVPAQYGRADTRTSAPEAVMEDRKRWGADFSLGGDLNSGNIEAKELRADFGVFRKHVRSTAYLSGEIAYQSTGGEQQDNQGALTARYDHSIAGKLKAFVFNTNAYDRAIELNYRMTLGAGPWYDLPLGDTRHGLSAALTSEYEKFRGSIIERAERLSLRDISRIPVSDIAELDADLLYAPKIGGFGDYHFFGEIGLNTLVWKDTLGLRLSWAYEYDSRPKPDIKPADVLWETSLTFRFGE